MGRTRLTATNVTAKSCSKKMMDIVERVENRGKCKFIMRKIRNKDRE